MANIKSQYGTTTPLTITLASLASGSARESTAVVNTSDRFLDAGLQLAFKLAAGAPTAPDGGQPRIEIYVYGSIDGSSFTDNATGVDAAITPRDPTNLTLLGILFTPTSGALTWKGALASVAAAFGGILPAQWGVVVKNMTGLAFSATEGDHSVQSRGIYATST